MSDANTTLLASWEEKKEESDSGMTFVRIAISGSGHCTAIINAVRDNYNRLVDRPKPELEDIEAYNGQKVTLITCGENMLGGGMIKAQEGKIFSSTPGTVAMLPKGARTKGFRIKPENVLAILPGYDTSQAALFVADARWHFPELTEIDHDRLCQLPEWDGEGEESAPITLCAFGTWRMPDGASSDAIQLIATYDKENDICDGGVLLIRPEFGISEHGSCYGRQITHSFGEVKGFEPITLREGLELCNLDFDEAMKRVLPRRVIAGVGA